jgi:uncharacterized membrane protein
MCTNARQGYTQPTMADSASPRRRRNGTAVPSRKGLAPSKIVVHGNAGTKITHTITIRKPAHQLYAFCRGFENLTRVITHPVTITERSPVESHWVVSAPPGEHPIEWDALIINDEPDQLIAWRSHETSEIVHAGTIRFDPLPGDAGTEVTVTIDYVPPGGKTGEMLAKISRQEASHHVVETLQSFKTFMETSA